MQTKQSSEQENEHHLVSTALPVHTGFLKLLQ